jgi:hypothetical protein
MHVREHVLRLVREHAPEGALGGVIVAGPQLRVPEVIQWPAV